MELPELHAAVELAKAKRAKASSTLLLTVMANTAGQWHALNYCYSRHRKLVYDSLIDLLWPARHGRLMLGKRVRKFFPGYGRFEGKVISCNREDSTWYVDGVVWHIPAVLAI